MQEKDLLKATETSNSWEAEGPQHAEKQHFQVSREVSCCSIEASLKAHTEKLLPEEVAEACTETREQETLLETDCVHCSHRTMVWREEAPSKVAAVAGRAFP